MSDKWYDKFIAFDTETTGIGKDARILELAILTFENGECVDRWSTLFNPPDVQWDDEKVATALSINKLTVEDLADAPTFSDYADHIYNLLASTKNWCAHNLPFDVRMLEQEFARIGRTLPKDYVSVDTMILDGIYNPQMRGRKLYEVADRWGVLLTDAHTAEADTACCANIFVQMCAKNKVVELEEFQKRASSAREKWDSKFKR